MFGKWFLLDKDPAKTPVVHRIEVRQLGLSTGQVVVVRRVK